MLSISQGLTSLWRLVFCCMSHLRTFRQMPQRIFRRSPGPASFIRSLVRSTSWFDIVAKLLETDFCCMLHPHPFGWHWTVRKAWDSRSRIWHFHPACWYDNPFEFYQGPSLHSRFIFVATRIYALYDKHRSVPRARAVCRTQVCAGLFANPSNFTRGYSNNSMHLPRLSFLHCQVYFGN